MNNIIIFNNTEFKCIDCVKEYAKYHSIYVSKEPLIDEDERSYQVLNIAWGKQKIIHPIYDHKNRDGYLQVNLPRINGKKLQTYVHRLVYLTWGENLPKNYQELDVNHKDENKTNNRLDNLELITHQENLNYGTHNQRVADALVKNANSANVVAINIQTRKEFHFNTASECARTLDLKQPHVIDCLNGKRRSHHGYVFCYEEHYSKKKVNGLINNVNVRCQKPYQLSLTLTIKVL